MEITNVHVFPRSEGRLKAFVTVVFDNCFIVRDMKVIEGNRGLFVAMPSKKKKDGTFGEVAHPLNADMRDKIEHAVLDLYHQMDHHDQVAAGEN